MPPGKNKRTSTEEKRRGQKDSKRHSTSADLQRKRRTSESRHKHGRGTAPAGGLSRERDGPPARRAGSRDRRATKGSSESPRPVSAYNDREDMDDAEIIRWDFVPPQKYQPKFVSAQKGMVVQIIGNGRVQEFTHEIPKVQIAETGCRGYINPAYIVSRRDLRDTVDPLHSRQWFVRDLGPIDASMLLGRTTDTPSGQCPPAGAMIVCAPPEYERSTAWREYLILIKMYDGTERDYTEKFEAKDKNNQAIKFDRFPGLRAVPPMILYLRVRREKYGMYHYSPGTDCLATLDSLVEELHGLKTLVADVDGMCPEPRCIKAVSLKYVDTPPPPPIPMRFIDWVTFGGDTNVHASLPSPLLLDPPKGTLSLEKKIGHGYYGETHLGRYGGKGTKAVVKFISDKTAADVILHLNVFEQMRKAGAGNPIRGAYYLAKYYEMSCLKPGDKSTTYIVREYFDQGTLEEVMQRQYEKRCLPARALAEIAYQVCSAMLYLADNELVHGQLAARNVMVTKAMHNTLSVRVADYFVYTPALKDLDRPTDESLWSKVRLEQDAPEVLAAKLYSRHADMWSFGVFLCELFNGCKSTDRPYGTLLSSKKDYGYWTPNRLRHCILEGERPMQPDVMPPDLYRVCHWCWQLERGYRPRFHTLFSHFNDLLFNMMDGSAKAVMDLRLFSVRLDTMTNDKRAINDHFRAEIPDEIRVTKPKTKGDKGDPKGPRTSIDREKKSKK